MSVNVLTVMKKHLKSAEKYIKAMQEAETADEYIIAMKTCASEVRAQYKDFEAVSDEYNSLMVLSTATDELKEVSRRTGDCFGSMTVDLLPKMAVYMNDEAFVKAQRELDDALMGNPLFSGGMDDSAMVEVAKSFASTMGAVAEKLHAETEEINSDGVLTVLQEFDSLAKRYNNAVIKADTARKFVTANDAFVSAVKKLIPQMNDVANDMRLLAAKGNMPEDIDSVSKSLRTVLGDELKEILKDKRELMADMKVQKSVSKLGNVLNSLPF